MRLGRPVVPSVLCATVLLICLLPVVGHTEDIDQSSSNWLWNDLVTGTEGEAVLTCPAGDGPTSITAYVASTEGGPLEGATVWLEVVSTIPSSTPYQCIVESLTDDSGNATLVPRVGLDCSGSTSCYQVRARVRAHYLGGTEVTLNPPGGGVLPDVREWVSFDLNADGVLNGSPTEPRWGDLGIFAEDFGVFGCRTDWNRDGDTDLDDYAAMLNHVQNHPSLSMNPASPIDFGTQDPDGTYEEVVTLTNNGGANLNWQLIASDTWITDITPSSGTLVTPTSESGTSVAVTIEINTTGLDGPTTGEIDVVSNSPHLCLIDDPIIVTVNVPTGPIDSYWDGGGDGVTWEGASNWDPDEVPDANSIAHIDLGGTYTVTYNSSGTIHSLVHGAATGTQTLDIETGSFGVTEGATNTSKIVVRSGASFDASAGGDAAHVVNEVSGEFVLDNGDVFGSGLFTNRGLLRKVGGLSSRITMDFTNELPGRSELPLVLVESGELSFEGVTELNGRMVVNSGGTAITSGSFKVIDSEVTVEAGGELVVQDTVLVTSTGSLDVSGALIVEGGGVLMSSGGIDIQEGGELIVDGELTNGTGGQLIVGGTVNVPTGGTLTNDGYFDLEENGTMTGGGTVDNTSGTAAIKGLVAPGDGEGTLTFLGDFVQSPTSEISLEIGGYAQGSTYDHLAVSGFATLDGAVAVTLTNGFEPVVDDSFQAVTHAGAGPGGTSFECYSGLEVSGSVYLDPLHWSGQFVLKAVGGSTGNTSPVAVDDAASVTGYAPITIDVLDNDSDADLDDLRVILLDTSTSSGIAYINEDDLLVSYAALPGHAGTDSFDYVVTDCHGGAAIGRVRINVTAPPQVLVVPDDVPTIAGALALASSGDTIVLECGTYYESDLTVPSGVTITSETGDPDCVTIDADGRAGRVFYVVDADSTTAIIGITATGGGGVTLGGGLYLERATPSVIDCAFEGNAAASGGGVACADGSSASFTRCVVSGNTATSGGGGFYCTGGSSATFESCTVVGNEAPLAGGSGLLVDDATALTLDRTIVAFGVTGEAVACAGTGSATFTCSDLYGNAGGDWAECVSGQGTVDGNFSLDPDFCAAGSGDYHLTDVSPCADAPGCGLVGALGAGCLGVPDIDVSPTSFTFDLSAGETATDSLLISDLGRPDLTWLVRESAGGRGENRPLKARVMLRDAEALDATARSMQHVEVPKGGVDPRPGRAPARGSGGPDAFGYTWVDSDDPAGPTYSWREISGSGTAVVLTDDDHIEVALPFTFPFYAELELLVSIGSNGYLTFGSDGDDYSNDPIPDSWTPNNIVAPFWDDLDPESGGAIYYYHDAVAEEFIVQYDAVYDYYGDGPYTFEVVLKSDGSILFLYDDITGAPASATVGIEDASGTTGLEVVFNSAYITSGLAVLIEDAAPWLVQTPRSGVVSGLGIATVVLDVDTGGLPQGIYSVDLVIESDDPDEPEVTVPVTLLIDVVGIDDEVPARYVLYGNYPNPFNPKTEIRYDLPARATVTLEVYSIAGRLVRRLVEEERQGPGPYRITWDGRDRSGRNVASGVYYYKLEADGDVLTSRMVLLK